MMAFSHRLKQGLLAAFALGLIGIATVGPSQGPALAQTAPPPVNPPAPAPATPPSAPAVTPPAATPEPAKPQAESSGGQQREIIPQPVLRLRSQGTWDEAHNAIRKAIDQVAAEVQKQGLTRQGNPMAYFVDSDDLGFTFEAMIPLTVMPEPGKTYSQGFEPAMSPGGRSVVFPYEGANDEIDNAYEALTAWLDDKGLVSTGRYLEEYEFLPEKGDDPGMRAKIVIFLK